MRFVSTLATFIAISAIAFGSKVELVNNGYQNVVVAISSNAYESISASEASAVIQDIKNLITNASARLFEATRNRAYFDQVSILIPENWPFLDNVDTSTWQTFVDADIRVDTASATYGDTPYAEQPRGCGQQGDYVHITPGFINGVETELAEEGAQLVMVWSQYRYGVYEEYGHPGDPRYTMYYYTSTGDVAFTSCTDTPLNGEMKDVTTGGECSFDAQTQLPDINCGYYIDENDITATSSIMTTGYLPTIINFCDDDEHTHNAEAPNRHNDLCNSTSTWSIVSKNQDFNNNPVTDNYVEPTFQVVRSNDYGKIVFVIDVSGSMSSPLDRIGWVSNATKYWIQEQAPDGTEIGIVKFSSSAKQTLAMTNVSSSTRDTIANAVPTTATGGTCIGCGVEQGLTTLHELGSDIGGNIMVLLTDGEENIAPYIDSVLPDVETSGIRVLTIALGTSADANLEQLANVTDGWTYYVTDTTSIYALSSALNQLLSQITPYDTGRVTLVQTSLDTTQTGSFYVDSSFDSNLQVDISYSSGALTAISLQNSDNDLSITDATQSYESLNVYHYSVTSNASGQWSYSITASSNTNGLMIQASGLAATGQQPIRADAYGQLLSGYQYGQYMFMYARVRRGYDPVIGADVVATVTRPSCSSGSEDVDVILTDDGNGVTDMIKNDGTYSGILTSYCGAGRYTFVVAVNSSDQTYVVTAADTVSTRRKRDTLLNPTASTNTVDESTGTFVRSASGGSVAVTAAIPEGADFFPPGKVNDLACSTSGSASGTTFTLTWTAPGSDLYSGTADSYDLRYSTDRSVFINGSLDHATEVTSDSLTSGVLTPQQAGNVQSAVILMQIQSNVTYYFAIRANDTSGNVGQISNIATGFVVVQEASTSAVAQSSATLWLVFTLLLAAAYLQ